MASKNIGHKSGPLKQQNKAHKHGRHRTKGQLENSFKGKVASDAKSVSRKNKLDKQQRRHQSKQIRSNKREEVLAKKRKIGTDSSAPQVVALFSLSPTCQCDVVLQNLVDSDDSIVAVTGQSITTIVSTKHRQRFQIIQPKRNLYSVLDAAKIADSFLFVIPANGEIDELSERCLTCIIAQGLPSHIEAIQGLRDVKKQGDVKKSIQKQLEKWIPETKLHSIDNKQDAGLILRLLANQKQRQIYYREHRSYMLADKVKFCASPEDENNGILKISGYLRGKPLSVNKLVHLPRLGDFQLKQIDLPKDPYSTKRGRDANGNTMADNEKEEEMEEDVKTIAVADPSKQESLVAEAEVDPMDAEQTWPTEEELQHADDEAKEEALKKLQRVLKKVPKGTSEYQAAWIDDENDDFNTDEDGDDESDEEMSDDGNVYAKVEQSESEEEPEEYDTISVAATTVANDERYDEQFDEDEEQRELEKYRLEHENEMFPDEVDTPQSIRAKERFQKYRGLKSFKTSPWDTKENLPLDYARIFQFQNFNHTKKKVLKEDINDNDNDNDGALDGWYITIHIDNVPKIYLENRDNGEPLVIFGLLSHEQKMTVMNFVVKRHPTCTLPVKSKEKLIIHAGYRTFSACPIFSQHTNGDKFKSERFFPHDGVTVATVFAPIMFPPAPVLMFTENHELLATGTVLGCNPNRVVVKKIVLSGHPFKINKRSSVVRYMFFARDDILWFKPVELFTKYGRRGNIKEPLGTHGHMKCVFNGQLKAQDTVCMNLYKRIFPKWTYEPYLDRLITIKQHSGFVGLSGNGSTNNEDVDGDVNM